MFDVYVIGCGGVGGYILDELPGTIASISLDGLGPYTCRNALINAGRMEIASVVRTLTIVDGDRFEVRNAMRQGAGAGDKVVQRYDKLKHDLNCLGYLTGMEIIAYRNYVTPDNVQTIIPKKPPTLQVTHIMNQESAAVVNQRYIRSDINDYTVVFMCVDNIKTRYELSKYMETFDSCLLFNGGNSKTSGHVTAYERCRGEELDPPLYEIYPNVTPDADKRPDELDCGTVSPEHDQVAVTNSMIANVMLAMFARWCRQGLSSYGRSGNRRYNEVLINCDDLTMTPLTHPRK